MFPTIKWAQTSDTILFKIFIDNVTGLSINFNDNKINFVGYSNNEKYEVNLEFYNKIHGDLSNHSYKICEYYIDCKIKKDKDINWDYLIKNQNFHKHHIQIDWLRWNDPDNEGYDDTTNLNSSMKELLNGMYSKSPETNNSNLKEIEQSVQLNLNGLEVDNNELLNNGVASGESTPRSSDDDEHDLTI